VRRFLLALLVVAATLVGARLLAQQPVIETAPVTVFGGPLVTTGTPLARTPLSTQLVGTFGQLLGTTTNPLMVATVAAPGDPCTTAAKLTTGISQTASTQILAGVPGKRIFLCAAQIGNNADAENVSIVEGTGTTCATNTYALDGGTTAAGGSQGAANSGFAVGNGGAAVLVTQVPGDNVCVLQSGSGRVPGFLTYAVQ
jgi:hypothetical protein